MKKKIIAAAVVVAVAAVGVLYVSGKNGEESVGPVVSTSAVTQEDIKESISLRAPLEGTESAEIVSNLHYEVLQVNVKEGDLVKKGQVLAVLDSETLKEDIRKAQDQLSLAQAQNSEASEKNAQAVELAKLQLEDSLKTKQTAYDQAVTEMNEAKRKCDNLESLVAAGAATEEALKEAQNTYENAKSQVESYHVVDGKVVPTEAELKSVENVADNTQASTAKSIEILQRELADKQKDLEECEITSPIDGTVTRVNIKMGRFADDTDDDKPMFVVENIEQLEMKVMVSEYDIGKVEIGQPVTISADILKDETVEGVVDRISPTGEEKSGSTERVIPTTVQVTGDNKGLIAGINAKAEILIAESKNAMTIPLECLVENADGSTQVLRVNSQGIIEVIPVETGVENDISIEVISDRLQPGDQVVISPTPDLVEGTAVTVLGGMPNANGTESTDGAAVTVTAG